MKKIYVIVVLVALLVLSASPAVATEGGNFKATLSGYEEVPAVSSPGVGEFQAKLTSNGMAIEYTLTYSGLQNAVASHIHLGQFSVNGGVAAFLCGGGGKPACPSTGGTVTGTITANDVVGPTAQGIAAGEFHELVAAMTAGVTYVNVHTNDGVAPTNTGPGDLASGEIRGQIH